MSRSTRVLTSAALASSSLDLRLDLRQVGGELLLQKRGFFFDAGMAMVLLAPGFQGDEFLELVAPDDQGRQGRFALGGRRVACGLHGRAEVAQDGSVEHVGLGQAALGTGKGTHPGGIVHAGGDLGALEGA